MFEFNFPVAHIPEEYRDFLPTLSTPAIDDLIREYEHGEAEMRRLHADLMSKENRPVLASFAYGAEVYKSSNISAFWAMDLLEMFNLSRGINARQECWWFKLFDRLGLTYILPADLWEQWHDSFKAWRTLGKDGTQPVGIPRFDHSTVYGVLSLIEAHRANFFSMRTDALWRSLSGYHKTNWGGAFHKRFILNSVFSEGGGTNHDKVRVVQDLINVCSTVMTGADDPFTDANGFLEDARKHHCGEWFEVMDGALRIKAFMVGTLHVEVHPVIANKLNIALAYIHPKALPDEATLKKPLRKSGFGSSELIKSVVPRQVRSYLRNIYQEQTDNGLWKLRLPSYSLIDNKRLGGAIRSMLDDVLAQIGGVRDGDGHLFDYPPADVVAQIVATGEVPEKVSHQFYSTSAELAKEFVGWVGVSEADICYETSAGMGGIAKHMPLQTHCVEIDRLRALALDKMGFEVTRADFLSLKPGDLHGEADAVLMNPPYAGRVWQSHFEHAVQFVREGGVIGAILPEGAVRKMPSVNGIDVVYSKPLGRRFNDASISVVFAKWVRAAAQRSGAAVEEAA